MSNIDVSVERMVLESHNEDSVIPERLEGCMLIAVEGLRKFFTNFPEIAEIYDGLSLKTELANILVMPITSAYALGYEARRREEQAE